MYIFLLSLFLSFVYDFHLQGILAQMKQKSWWLNHKEYKPLYKFDYIVALIVHSFEWALCTMVPYMFLDTSPLAFSVILLGNVIVHAFVDDLKANRLKINLIVDQSIHLLQVVLTFVLFRFL